MDAPVRSYPSTRDSAADLLSEDRPLPHRSLCALMAANETTDDAPVFLPWERGWCDSAAWFPWELV